MSLYCIISEIFPLFIVRDCLTLNWFLFSSYSWIPIGRREWSCKHTVYVGRLSIKLSHRFNPLRRLWKATKTRTQT